MEAPAPAYGKQNKRSVADGFGRNRTSHGMPSPLAKSFREGIMAKAHFSTPEFSSNAESPSDPDFPAVKYIYR
jgi:hypothetical protein